MDIDKYVFNIFSSFVRDLSKTFPEIKNCLFRNYEKEILGENLKLNDCLKLKSFLLKIEENSKLIENKDEKFFEIEDILEEISFKKLWEKNITDKTKTIIWKYFQTFTIININLNSSQKLQDALSMINDSGISKENIEDKETIKDLKKLKKLTENVKENKTEDEIDLENIMGGFMDSNIGSIAKEVASSMNINEMFGDINENSNPMEVMSKMMNPENMKNIFGNINSVMEEKMKDGELNEDILKKEAENVYSNMSDNPLFGNLMQEMNKDKNNQSENQDTKLTRDEQKKKLKEKIKKKEKERSK